MRRSVLIVEDDLTLAGNLYIYLEAQGFMPDVAYDGYGALTLLESRRFDVVVLDLGLPGMDGIQVLHVMRERLASGVPVLVLTARDALQDKLAGFAQGADDYLTKPYALAEVQARLSALIQRAEGTVGVSRRLCGRLCLDVRAQTVSVDGKVLRLTRKSVQILTVLLREPGKVMTRHMLEDALWAGAQPPSDALRSQMHLLRRALSEVGFDGIETVHGIGWRLHVDHV